MKTLRDKAKRVFKVEAEAILNLSNFLTEDFEKSIEMILELKGRVVVTGMGKSGIIGKKIVATLASTGTPSFFMHPAEAIHGDLGMLTRNDILIAISNSGESDEILKLIPLIKRMQIQMIVMAGNKNSSLGKEADSFLNISVQREACPLQLAPMASTTATLAMGDALAAVLMEERKFKPEDFAIFHPGGSLGRKLLTKVKDIMQKKSMPIVKSNSSFSEIIEVMTSGKLGLAIVMEDEKIVGLITDGDLRRALKATEKLRFNIIAKEMMTSSPKIIDSDVMAIDAEKYMIKEKINELLVVDNHQLVGVVQLFDIGFIV